MPKEPLIDVIIPAYNEESSIGMVLNDIPSQVVREVIVCNNASTDNTEMVAKEHGATVVLAAEKGYGSACLEGISYIKQKSISPDIVVFLDGDYSDHPEELIDLVKPIVEEDVDLVIGSRALGQLESGSMMPQQIFGNWLATTLIKFFYKYTFTDLGPFRALRFGAYQSLGMRDRNWGWTVEMQLRAAQYKLKIAEVPVRYRKRISGESKISGSIKGTLKASTKILYVLAIFTIRKYWPREETQKQ